MLEGGGTTCGLRGPTPVLAIDLPPASDGGGGTGFARNSPEEVLPQLLSSRLTWDGGGATTAGAGSYNSELGITSRRVADTGGATTSTVCVSGTRALAKSRCVSRGAGATTVGASEVEVRILSRETFGVGGTIAALNAGDVRLVLVEISGAGAMTFIAGAFIDRLADELNSGEGATTLIAGKVGAVRDERKPSAGGGPGFALKASRLATAESECGRLTLGASTTFSTALSPRATRIACVRWWACCPPARPVFPACAPPRSFVRGS